MFRRREASPAAVQSGGAGPPARPCRANHQVGDEGRAMDIGQLGRLGSSDLRVTRLGFGCVPIANLYSVVSDEEAMATVRAAYDSGIRLFDTAPQYGHGLAEHRLGDALRWQDRDTF